LSLKGRRRRGEGEVEEKKEGGGKSGEEEEEEEEEEMRWEMSRAAKCHDHGLAVWLFAYLLTI
jgi:hypothetical protein